MASASGISLLCLSLSSSFASGMSTSAIALTVFLMYSGFLQRRDAIPPALRWLVDISPFAHSFAAMISSELGGLETVIDTDEHATVNIQGDIWLYQFNIDPGNMPQNARVLGTFTVCIWVLAFIPIWRGWYRSTSCSFWPQMPCMSRGACRDEKEANDYQRQ
ncbi:unnamed protein product [Polarella glacialis]|uniref:ABC-2 type transporter transmembrane domain-containing protein n=1 Tax=Polarella glacialis TaxID=89957 RepID=A0A813JX96_POLGL|nr:unnamed protein product [Polarella glacialis]CAE8688237.1 unnamed protein product [Polarella glacialis]